MKVIEQYTVFSPSAACWVVLAVDEILKYSIPNFHSIFAVCFSIRIARPGVGTSFQPKKICVGGGGGGGGLNVCVGGGAKCVCGGVKCVGGGLNVCGGG